MGQTSTGIGMQPRIRTMLACIGLLIYLCLYAFLAANLGAQLVRAPALAQLGFFAVAGLAWALPLRPLFGWLSRGARPANPPKPIP